MRSYKIDTDRLVNLLTPHYLGGRKIILFLQSLLAPLKSVGTIWESWATDKRIEAVMTSQVIILEYFLNRKFQQYLEDPSQRIVISDGKTSGIPLYWEAAISDISYMTLYTENEKSKSNPALRWKDEKMISTDYSFIVSCPAVNLQKISEAEMTAMISYYVNLYRIAGKKFSVIYN